MSKTSTNTIAVLGSAFNPPSLGHKSIINRLKHYDKVLLVPSISHAWGKKMADFTHRCHWVEAFIDDIEQSNVELSDIEKSLFSNNEPVTTWQVLSSLSESYPTSDITFVVGPDNLLKFANFHKAEEITKRWNVLACPETLAIRSTDIRNALCQKEEISHLTTPGVAELLKKFSFSD